MQSKKLFDSESGAIILVEENPNWFIEASANTIAVDVRGNIYRKSSVEGAGGWILLCVEGGPRGNEIVDALIDKKKK